MIEIKEQKINNYIINQKIDEALNTGIFIDNDKILEELAKIIAGINKGNVFYLNKFVYDNKEYFSSRVYIDNNKNYLNTLDANKICKYMLNNYFKAFDSSYFKEMIRKIKLRLDVNIKDRYYFNNNSNVIANDIFALSLMCVRIILHPFNKTNEEQLNVLKDAFKVKKGNILLGNIANNDYIYDYKGILDEIIIMHNDKIHKFNNNDEILKIVKDKISNNISIITNAIYEDNYFYYVTKDIIENKNLKGILYENISIYDIGKKHEC